MFLSYWKVLSFFLIPIGGGIPGGVLLAKHYGIAWPATTVLYFVSDVILACMFEPIMLALARLAKRSLWLTKFRESYSKGVEKTVARYGGYPGPAMLILIAFSVDPMTGRVAAKASGHNFIMGWLFAIAGDMVFFALLMLSTLWLNGILGDGTLTTVIIIAAMIIVPRLIRKLRELRAKTR